MNIFKNKTPKIVFTEIQEFCRKSPESFEDLCSKLRKAALYIEDPHRKADKETKVGV